MKFSFTFRKLGILLKDYEIMKKNFKIFKLWFLKNIRLQVCGCVNRDTFKSYLLWDKLNGNFGDGDGKMYPHTRFL
jgi:hypothetical protein